MKVALLPKKTRGETAQIELRLDIGDTETLRNSSPVSAFTAAMLERGTAKHDRQAFADALDKLRAKLDIGGGGATVAVDATTVRGSVPDVLRLAAEALREPAFVPAEFEQLKRERLDGARAEPHRPDGDRAPRRGARRQSVSARRRPLHADDRRGDRARQRAGARGRQGVPREVLRRVARRAGHRRRFRCGRREAAGPRAVRRLREPDAVRARPAAALSDEGRAADVRDARQGQRGDVRPPVDAAQRRGGRLSRRWSSPIGCSAATATRGSSSASA